MYDYASGKRLRIRDASGQPLDVPQIVRLALKQQSAAPPAIQIDVGVDLGTRLRLLGYATVPPLSESGELAVSPGDPVRLTLYWQALARPVQDYARFMHLVNERGEIVAQSDILVGAPRYPTGLWEVGEWVADEVMLVVPMGLPPGSYALLAGLYEPTTVQRLTLTNGADHLQLFVVEVR